MASLGASLGGLANSRLGPQLCFVINSVTYLANAGFVYLLRLRAVAPSQQQHPLQLQLQQQQLTSGTMTPAEPTDGPDSGGPNGLQRQRIELNTGPVSRSSSARQSQVATSPVVNGWGSSPDSELVSPRPLGAGDTEPMFTSASQLDSTGKRWVGREAGALALAAGLKRMPLAAAAGVGRCCWRSRMVC